MNKSVATKTGLLVLFIGLMLPFGVILFLLLGEIESRMSGWEDARSGVVYHRNVRQILDHTLTYADLATQAPGAKSIDGKTLSQTKQALERDIKNFDSLSNQQRPSAQWRSFKTSWQQLQKSQGAAKTSNLDSLIEHIVAISAQADDRIVRVPSARSNADVMDTLIADIPALAADIERAGRWSLKAGDKDELRSLSAMIASSLADSARKIPPVSSNEAPASVQLYQQAKKSTRDFLTTLDSSLLSEKNAPENLLALSQKSRAAYFQLYDELSRDMENNIAAQIESDGQRKFFIEVFATLVVLIIVCIFWRIADLTAQHSRAEQNTRESEARFRSIVDAARDAVVGMDMNGQIREWNPQAEALFGWSREEAIGQRLSSMIIPPEFREAHEKGLNRYLETGEAVFLDKRVEVMAQDRRDNRFSVELSITVVHVDGVPMFNAFVRDITARKQAEAQLQQAKEDAETANVSKSQFLANMSHELRTPLNAIIGYSEMLQEEAEDVGQEDFVPDLQKIQVAGKHLLALINDILDLSKIEAGKMDVFLEEFDVAEMIRGVVTIITPLAQKNNNQLVVTVAEDVGVMRADLTKVRQSLFNLLSNACKFTHEGTVTLEASRASAADDDTLNFRVLDSGIGLSEEQMGKLFQAFTQADASTTRKYGGTGLGLAISRRFCQMMGGDITVESKQGEGSTFTIVLPAEVAEPVRDEGATSPTHETAGVTDSDESWQNHTAGKQSAELNKSARRVLVIDDDPAVHALIRRHLNKEGMKVMAAHSGTEGLYMAKAMRPDVITLDVLMPGMDGWAVLSALKEDRELTDIPVVMLSSMDDVGLATALGAADYLMKPIDGAQLLECLKKPQRNQPVYPLLLVQDDTSERRETMRVLEKYGWPVQTAENGRAALRRLAEMPHEPCAILLQWKAEESSSFLQALQQNEKWRSIDLIVMATGELNEDEQAQLKESSHVFWNGQNHEELLREIRSMVAACAQSNVAQ